MEDVSTCEPNPVNGFAVVPSVEAQQNPYGFAGWNNVTIDIQLTPTDHGAARCLLFMER